eukprot:Seg234.6 transcript_id=Seg234.6/GoldUCD/mRNA.D3Y31 product="hypothetical protein" protein_id=Seg234.6/GoldUCD/D3Y31
MNFIPTNDAIFPEDGECEDCGVIVDERQLMQCKLGFCGTFLCYRCVTSCSLCLTNGRNFADDRFVFCRGCANSIVPECVACKKRYCGRCTSFRKCIECPNSLCSGCQLKDDHRILFNGKCNQCSRKAMRKLQELCRDVIRRTIACNLAGFGWDRDQRSTPTIRINNVIKEQKLPRPIIDLLLIKN